MVIAGRGTKGRLESCDIAGNKGGGLIVQDRGDPTLIRCTIRDHAAGAAWAGSGSGVWVRSDAKGKTTVAVDCVFMRNAGGDVVRK